MSTQTPPKKPGGKPTTDQDNHDKNVGQREETKSGTERGKPTIEPDTRGGNYGQREGSTISEDNDVE